MGISQSAIGALYLYAAFLGLILGAVYDCLRITRVFFGNHYSRRAARRLQEIRLPLLPKAKAHGESRALGVIVFFEDLLFCLLAGVSLILLLYGFNNGKFRFFVVICACIGFLIYRGTLGRIVMLFSEVIAFFLETAFRYLVFFMLFPFRFLKRKLTEQGRALAERELQKRQRRERARYTKKQKRALVHGCGMIPAERSLRRRDGFKKGRVYATGTKKTVQPNADPARVSGFDRGGIGHRVCKQRDEI
jgi:hypothetical protein